MRWRTDSEKDCESTIICCRSKAGDLEGGTRRLPLNQNIHSSRLEMIFIFAPNFSDLLFLHLNMDRLTPLKLRTNLSRLVSVTVVGVDLL